MKKKLMNKQSITLKNINNNSKIPANVQVTTC